MKLYIFVIIGNRTYNHNNKSISMKNIKIHYLFASKFSILVSVFCLYIFFSCSKVNTSGSFASIEEDTMEVNIDTTAFKKFLETKLFSNKDIKFNTIQVRKQKALGAGKEFYYVYLATKDNSVKVARWLNKKGNDFYLNDVMPDEGVLFEQSYLVCRGIGECSPQLFIDGERRMWGGTTVVACYAGKENPYPDCKWEMTYIDPYK